LCLSLFDWAKFRQTKGAVKLHLLLDHEGYLPVFARITEGKTHEVKIAHELEFSSGSIVVIDRGFTDYTLFGRWTAKGVYFVTRLKRGADYRVTHRRHAIPERGILADEVIEFDGPVSKEKCPHPLRRIEYLDRETGEVFEFLTNHLEFGPTTIVQIYRDRWEIELFFKALKQNLKVKTFVGTSQNALKTQIWTALIAMLLLKYLQLRSRLKWSLSNLVALLRWNLFTYRELWTWLDDPFETPPLGDSAEQLALAFSSLGQQNGRP
jgi:IS4 transposase